MYFVYILTNRWKTVLYTGMTDSIEGRLSDHINRRFEGFTKKYNCTQLVYFEALEDADSAMAREKQIKGWTRAKKNALIPQSIRNGMIYLRRGSFASLRIKRP